MVDPELKPFAENIAFGEGMRWHGGRLWLSDMLGRVVLAFDADGQRKVMAQVPERPNGLGFLPDGRLLATSMADGKLLRREHDGSLVEHASLAHLMTGYCGDMAVDAQGRAYVDDVGFRVFEGAPAAPGRLLLVEADGSARVLEDDLAFPNGIWIAPGGTELIFAEGRKQTLWSYRINDDATLSDKQVFFNAPALLDGLTLDAEGAAWQCMPYAHQLVRVLRGGQVTHQFSFGELKPVACALGGPGLRTLYVVASDYTLERMATDSTTARIYAVEVDTPGFHLPGDRPGAA